MVWRFAFHIKAKLAGSEIKLGLVPGFSTNIIWKIGFISSGKTKKNSINQCCRVGAGGADIIREPGAGAENKF